MNESEHEPRKEASFVDKTIDYIFSMNRVTFYLILILIAGAFLRFFAAVNLSIGADEMHFVTHAINFIGADRLITWDQTSGLWFAFTDVMYQILGFSQFSSRFASFFFGSFSIIAIFLLTKEFFSKRVALFAAFLLAFSSFHTRYTVSEMDVMAVFFIIMGAYLFVKSVKTAKMKFYFLSGLFIGLGVYTKVYPFLFVPSLLLYFVHITWKKKEKVLTKRNMKLIAVFLAVIFFFSIPALTHNYLLYKNEGFLDYIFTKTLQVGKDKAAQYYSWAPLWDARNDWAGFVFGNSLHAGGNPLPTSLIVLKWIYQGTPVNFILGFLGLLFIVFYKKEYMDYVWLFFFSILFAYPYLTTTILLPKHFVFFEVFLIPMAALAFDGIIKSVSKIAKKNLTKYFVIGLLIFSLIFMAVPNGGSPVHVYGKNNVGSMIDFKNKNIPETSLVVGDSRIYRGRINWAFQGRPYLEGTEFVNILNQQDQLPGDVVNAEVFYYECVLDDCGWGTVKDQPEFNASMEALTDFFKQNGELVERIDEPDEKSAYFPIISDGKRIEVINIYRAVIPLKTSVGGIASQPKSWFLYTVGYEPKEEQFDYYEPQGVFQKLLDKLAHWIVLLSVLLAFLSPLYVIYEYRKK